MTFIYIIEILIGIFPIFKIARRKDINLFDVFLFFSSIYFAWVPLVVERDNFLFNGFVFRENIAFEANIICLLFFVVFFVAGVFIGSLNSFNITRTIRIIFNTLDVKKDASKVFFILCTIILLLCLYAFNEKIQMDSVSRDDIEAATDRAGGVFKLVSQLYQFAYPCLCFLYFLYFYKRKVHKAHINRLNYLTISFFVIMTLLGPRTQLAIMASLLLISLYSIDKRYFFSKRFKIQLLIITLLLPLTFVLITGFRFAVSLYKNDVVDVSLMRNPDLLYEAATTIDINDLESSNNAGSRSTYLYSSYVKSFTSSYQGFGLLALKALSYSMPRFLLPDKDLGGTQYLFENDFGEHIDIADSLILYSVMECRMLSSFIGLFIFSIYILIWHRVLNYMMLLKQRNKGIISAQYLTFAFFFAANIELGVDAYVANLFYAIITLLLILALLNYLTRIYSIKIL